MGFSRANHLIVWVSAFLLLFTVPIVAQDDSGEGDVLIDEAVISTVNFDSESLALDVTGELGDACTELGDVEQTIDGTTITVTIYTTRPADAMCAMVLSTFDTTIELDAAKLTAGANTLIVNGNEFDITIPAMAQTEPTATPEPVTCPTPADDELLYTSDTSDYCFVYPSRFIVEEVDEATTNIAADSAGGFSSVEMVITTEATGGRTLEAIEAQRQVDEAEQTLNFEAVTLGNEAAIVTEDITSRVPNRTLIAIHDDTVFTLTAWPIDESFGDENELANELWTTVTESFVFSPTTTIIEEPTSDTTDTTTSITCDDLTAEAGQAKYENNTFCFLYPDTYTPIGNDALVLLSSSDMFDGRSITFVIEVFPANDVPSMDDLAADVTATYPEQSLEFEGIQLAGVDALLTESIVERGIGTRHLYTVFDDKLITIQIQPVDAAYESAADAVDELWSMVTETWIFKSE